MIASWPCPLKDGTTASEYALTFDKARKYRLLILPALFDEAHKLRRFTVDVMRRLDGAGVDCFLPDLPGCNESTQALASQTVDNWQHAVAAAADYFGATHFVGMRGGSLFAPAGLPGWNYAPGNGAGILRQLLRARIIASREMGRDETQEGLLGEGLQNGLELAGYHFGAEFLKAFQSLMPKVSPHISEIEQSMLGGPGLWLRAEPSDDAAQADALAAILAIGIKA